MILAPFSWVPVLGERRTLGAVNAGAALLLSIWIL